MKELKKDLIKKQEGISLIELLLVIGVILIMAGIIVVVKNPVKEKAEHRNWQREMRVREIAQSLHQIKVHNNNKLPKTNDKKKIPKCNKDKVKVSKLSSVLVPDYLSAVPTDPKTSEPDYSICITEQDQIKVTAVESELDKEVSFAR